MKLGDTVYFLEINYLFPGAVYSVTGVSVRKGWLVSKSDTIAIVRVGFWGRFREISMSLMIGDSWPNKRQLSESLAKYVREYP